MEIETINVGGFNDMSFGRAQGRHLNCSGRLYGKSHHSREMGCHLRLRLIRKRPAPNQTAIREQFVFLRVYGRLNRHRTPLIPVELERRKKVYVLERRDVPAGNEALCSFGKSL